MADEHLIQGNDPAGAATQLLNDQQHAKKYDEAKQAYHSDPSRAVAIARENLRLQDVPTYWVIKNCILITHAEKDWDEAESFRLKGEFHWQRARDTLVNRNWFAISALADLRRGLNDVGESQRETAGDQDGGLSDLDYQEWQEENAGDDLPGAQEVEITAQRDAGSCNEAMQLGEGNRIMIDLVDDDEDQPAQQSPDQVHEEFTHTSPSPRRSLLEQIAGHGDTPIQLGHEPPDQMEIDSPQPENNLNDTGSKSIHGSSTHFSSLPPAYESDSAEEESGPADADYIDEDTDDTSDSDPEPVVRSSVSTAFSNGKGVPRRPQAIGMYYSDSCTEQKWHRFGHRQKIKLSHVGRIEETSMGRARTPACDRCVVSGHRCVVYIDDVQYQVKSCARCVFSKKACE